MKKVSLILLAMIFSMTNLVSTQAQSLASNQKNPFINKFIVLKKLVRLSNNKSENVSVEALNKIREVIFRGQNSVSLTTDTNQTTSVSYMVNRMNNDVDKIFEGVTNLENAVSVANLADDEDKMIIKLLKALVVDEIKLILSSNFFQESQEKNDKMLEDAEKYIQSTEYPAAQEKANDLTAISNLQKLLDLSWYIFAEQSQWLMATAFRLECLNFDSLSMKGNYFIIPEFNIAKPPRMFIPGQPDDYDLNGSTELQGIAPKR